MTSRSDDRPGNSARGRFDHVIKVGFASEVSYVTSGPFRLIAEGADVNRGRWRLNSQGRPLSRRRLRCCGKLHDSPHAPRQGTAGSGQPAGSPYAQHQLRNVKAARPNGVSDSFEGGSVAAGEESRKGPRQGFAGLSSLVSESGHDIASLQSRTPSSGASSRAEHASSPPECSAQTQPAQAATYRRPLSHRLAPPREVGTGHSRRHRC